MKYKYIVWDWNGTILDDTWLCLEVLNVQLMRRNLPQITIERYQHTFGHPIREHYRRNGFSFSGSEFDNINDEFISLYTEREKECGLRPGVLDFLKYAHDNGIAQSILSAYFQSGLEKAVSRFDIAQMFTNIKGMDNRRHNGKAEAGKVLVSESGLGVEQILYIGDVIADHTVSTAMGIDCCLVSGTQSNQRLLTCGARVINSFAELLA